MYGAISVTTSPSSFNIRRRTPCVLGCCGPMFTYISSIVSWIGSMISVCSSDLLLFRLSGMRRAGPLRRLVRDQPLVLVVLAQGMPDPILRGQNPTQVGMTFKANPHEIKGLPLVPVRRTPDRHDAPDDRVFPWNPHPHHGLGRLVEGRQVVDRFELAARDPVHGTDTVQIVEPHPLQGEENLVAFAPLDIHPGLDTFDLRCLDSLAELRFDRLDDLVGRHATHSSAPFRQA